MSFTNRHVVPFGAESVPEQLNSATWVNCPFCLHKHPPQMSISVLQQRLSFRFGEQKVKRRVTGLTSWKTVRPILQEVASSWALNAIQSDPTKTKVSLVSWEKPSQWDLVASTIAHHQQPSPQNHLLFPGNSPGINLQFYHSPHQPCPGLLSLIPPQGADFP